LINNTDSTRSLLHQALQLGSTPMIHTHWRQLSPVSQWMEGKNAYTCLKLVKLVCLFQKFLAQFHFRLQGLPAGHYSLLLCFQVFHLLLWAMGQHMIRRVDQLLQLTQGWKKSVAKRES